VVDREEAKQAVRSLIEFLGDDSKRPGVIGTPERVVKFYEEWMAYKDEPELRLFSESYDEMVIVRNIPFYSFCEHHILPFHGKAHIGYIPYEDGKVLGLSKMVRILNKYAHRLQIQERIGRQIADEIMNKVKPRGVMVVLEAEHLCMSLRGVRALGHSTITSAIRGVFKDPPKGKNPREEFLRLIK